MAESYRYAPPLTPLPPVTWRRLNLRTTWNDVGVEGKTEHRDYECWGHDSRMGRTSYRVTCPFCERTMRVYPWSLAGTGKRCDCGAIFGSRGLCYRLKETFTEP